MVRFERHYEMTSVIFSVSSQRGWLCKLPYIFRLLHMYCLNHVCLDCLSSRLDHVQLAVKVPVMFQTAPSTMAVRAARANPGQMTVQEITAAVVNQGQTRVVTTSAHVIPSQAQLLAAQKAGAVTVASVAGGKLQYNTLYMIYKKNDCISYLYVHKKLSVMSNIFATLDPVHDDKTITETALIAYESYEVPV